MNYVINIWLRIIVGIIASLSGLSIPVFLVALGMTYGTRGSDYIVIVLIALFFIISIFLMLFARSARLKGNYEQSNNILIIPVIVFALVVIGLILFN